MCRLISVTSLGEEEGKEREQGEEEEGENEEEVILVLEEPEYAVEPKEGLSTGSVKTGLGGELE